MSVRVPSTRWLVSLGALLAAPAAAQCSYPEIPPGVAVSFPTGSIQTPRIAVTTPAWVAVALRPEAGAAWDLGVYDETSGPPQCVTKAWALSSRAGSTPELLVGDFHQNGLALVPLGAYPLPLTPAGGATLEWDAGGDVITLNSDPIVRSMAADDLVECFELFVEAGRTYQIRFGSSGSAAPGIHVFESPGTFTYWASTISEIGESQGPGWFTVTPSVGGWMALVVTNRNWGPGDYSLAAVTCDAPTALVPNIPAAKSGLEFHFSLDQQRASFMALGARGDDRAQPWSMTALAGPANGIPSFCYDGVLAASPVGDRGVEYVVGDFRPGEAAPGTVYARSSASAARFSAMRAEWDDGSGVLTVDDPPIHGTTDAADVLRCWNVSLEAGVPYTIHFVQDGNADLELALFGRSEGGSWLARDESSALGTSPFPFTPAVGGDFALVLANDDAGTGTYELAVFAPGTGVDVGDGAPFVTALESIAPNPMASGCHIRFALARRSAVRMEVVDPTGRRRALLDAGTREPGQGSLDWDGRGDDGERLAAGVYFVRMSAEGRRVESSRVVILTR